MGLGLRIRLSLTSPRSHFGESEPLQLINNQSINNYFLLSFVGFQLMGGNIKDDIKIIKKNLLDDSLGSVYHSNAK